MRIGGTKGNKCDVISVCREDHTASPAAQHWCDWAARPGNAPHAMGMCNPGQRSIELLKALPTSEFLNVTKTSR